VKKNEIYNIKKKLEKNIKNFISTEIEWISINNIELEKEKLFLASDLLDSLDNNDDVQNVYTNLKITSN